MGDILYRLECHDKLDGRTVRIGNDAAGCIQRILRIDLRHHERHVGIHAERARIVYHQRPVFRNGLLELFGGTAARRYERHIHPLEIVVVAELLHLHPLAAELIKLPALRSEPNNSNSSTGKFLSANTLRNSCPTAPLAPTIATFIFDYVTIPSFPSIVRPHSPQVAAPVRRFAGRAAQNGDIRPTPHQSKTRRRPNSPSPPHCQGNGTLWLPADGRNGLSSALPTRGRHTLSS